MIIANPVGFEARKYSTHFPLWVQTWADLSMRNPHYQMVVDWQVSLLLPMLPGQNCGSAQLEESNNVLDSQHNMEGLPCQPQGLTWNYACIQRHIPITLLPNSPSMSTVSQSCNQLCVVFYRRKKKNIQPTIIALMKLSCTLAEPVT